MPDVMGSSARSVSANKPVSGADAGRPPTSSAIPRVVAFGAPVLLSLNSSILDLLFRAQLIPHSIDLLDLFQIRILLRCQSYYSYHLLSVISNFLLPIH